MELQLEAPRTLVSKPARVMSVDVLRGLVMFTMVFVNDAYGADGSPNWLKHWSDIDGAGPSGMTFVDLVFPSFLFIVGLAIPVALENRRAAGDSWLKIYGHVLLRTISLLFIGVLMVNGENVSDKTMGWKNGLWILLLYSGVVVAFHSVRFANKKLMYISWGIRALGLALLVFLAVKFRNKHGDGLEHSWWGILGLIGWAYFGATTFYLVLRKEGLGAMAASVGVLMCVYFADRTGIFRKLDGSGITLFGQRYVFGSWIALREAFGSQTAITMAGVVIGSMFLPSSELQSPRSKVRFAGVFSVLMVIGGFLLTKTFGISKNNATPTWCFYSAAIATALWIGLYLIIDVWGWRMWSIPLAWAGASALLIYVLSELWGLLNEYVVSWPWYDNLGDKYPQSIQHKLLTAAGLSLIGGVLGRVGFKLKL